MNNIVLIGFMGTGKSTISRYLAERLGWEAIDTDQTIEELEQSSISDLFKNKGEPYFRQVESRVIQTVMQRHHQVIATGGGAVLAEINRQNMLKNGFVVALTADVNTIVDRVSQDQSRPLLAGDVRKNVLELMEKRKHAYDFAHMKLDTSTLSVEEISDRIVKAYHQHKKK